MSAHHRPDVHVPGGGQQKNRDLSQDDDSAYKRFIMYVLPQDSNSNNAMQLLDRNSHMSHQTWVQDVRALPTKPTWLRGVPAVADTESKRAFLGTEALQFIQSFKPVGPTAHDGEAAPAMDDLFVIPDDDGSTEPIVQTGSSGSSGASQAAARIEQLRAQREQQDQQMKSRMSAANPRGHLMHR